VFYSFPLLKLYLSPIITQSIEYFPFITRAHDPELIEAFHFRLLLSIFTSLVFISFLNSLFLSSNFINVTLLLLSIIFFTSLLAYLFQNKSIFRVLDFVGFKIISKKVNRLFSVDINDPLFKSFVKARYTQIKNQNLSHAETVEVLNNWSGFDINDFYFKKEH